MCGGTRSVRKAGLKYKFLASNESGYALSMMLELAFAIGLAVHCPREKYDLFTHVAEGSQSDGPGVEDRPWSCNNPEALADSPFSAEAGRTKQVSCVAAQIQVSQKTRCSHFLDGRFGGHNVQNRTKPDKTVTKPHSRGCKTDKTVVSM